MSTYQYQAFADNAPFGYALHEIILDSSGLPADYRFLETNRLFEQLSGIAPDTARGMTFREIASAIRGSMPDRTETYGDIALYGGTANFNQYSQHLGRWYRVQVYTPAKYQVAAIYSDITDQVQTEKILQARLRLSHLSETNTMLEFLQKTLDEAESLTGSQIGFAHFLEADQVTLELQTWSTNTLLKMCTAEGKGQHYPINMAGVWVDCYYTRGPVVHNNYEALPHKKGLPEGHAPILRELLVPVIRGEMIVAIFGVGNKPTEYTEEDVETFVQLANLTWDIVQRKRAEESLAQREQWYRAIFDHSPSGVLLEDKEGTIVDFNDAFCQSLGYAREELIGMNINILIPPKRIKEVEDHFRLLRYGKPMLHIVENIKKDRTRCWMELNETLIRLPDGRDGFLVVSNDITDRVLAEQELREAKRKAEESNLLKSAFLANMSHEIRTPMGGIMGFLGLLQEEDITPEERDYYISMMNEGAQRLLDTINDIIDMSKIETGNIEIINEKIVIQDIMDYLYNFFKPQTTAKSLSLRFTQRDSSTPEILVSDRMKLEAILTNLIKNAIKFTSRGGIEYGYYPKNDMMVFYVRDSGIGIPPDRLDAIFERFIQADMTLTRGHEGSGLGLAISKAYCEALGGKLQVESTFGKGSTFSFALPYGG